jgi:serine/threonine protein phosphatase 1
MIDTPRIFAIGDIHGEYEKLTQLIQRLPFDQTRKDTLVFIGDYINRGTQSSKVISFLIDLKIKIPNTVFLMGNHEYTLLTYAKTKEESLLSKLRHMKVEETLKSYQCQLTRKLSDLSFLPQDHYEFLTTLSPYYRVADYLFVHAGLVPGIRLEEHTVEMLVDGRSIFHETEENRWFTVVFGHIPFEMPLVTRHSIGIDTGATYGNLLTAIELPTLRFYHS